MNTFWITWTSLLLWAAASAPARADEHVVGNPGDPARLHIAQARNDARIIMIRVSPAQLVTANSRAASFYRDNYSALDIALRDARFEFVLDARPTCALAVMTELTIYFSYPKCVVLNSRRRCI